MRGARFLLVKQIASSTRCDNKERCKANLTGLRLGKINRVRKHLDTPEVRGMIAKIPHLVVIVGEDGQPPSKAADLSGDARTELLASARVSLAGAAKGPQSVVAAISQAGEALRSTGEKNPVTQAEQANNGAADRERLARRDLEHDLLDKLTDVDTEIAWAAAMEIARSFPGASEAIREDDGTPSTTAVLAAVEDVLAREEQKFFSTFEYRRTEDDGVTHLQGTFIVRRALDLGDGRILRLTSPSNVREPPSVLHVYADGGVADRLVAANPAVGGDLLLSEDFHLDIPHPKGSSGINLTFVVPGVVTETFSI